MTTTDKIQYGSSTTVTSGYNSLASSTTAGYGSAAVDNSTNLYDDAQLLVSVVTGAGTLAAPFACYVYLYGSDASGAIGIYLGSSAEAEGTAGAMTFDVPTNLLGPFVINCPASSVTYRLLIGSVASVFGGILPYKWGLAIRNQTGQTLATSANNTAVYTGIYFTNG